MLADAVLLKVADWTVSVFAAARNKREQRYANVLQHASTLAAGTRYLDRRYTELFAPLTFYRPAAWPKERRIAQAEAIVTFLSEPKVLPKLAASLYWLATASDSSDGGVPEELRSTGGPLPRLMSTVAVGVWMTADPDELLFPSQPQPPPSALAYVPQPGIPGWEPPAGQGPPPPAPVEADAVGRAIETWRALADQGGPWAAVIQDVISRPDPELFYDLPRTEDLLDLLHEDDPAPEAVRAAVLASMRAPAPHLEARRMYGRYDHDAPGAAVVYGSPIRPYADRAASEFVEVLVLAQQRFPGVPSPDWMFDLDA
ncbi:MULTISPECIES: hypothetical protein [unclassified Nocardioides]|uniref:hypothetical protein n=1 Tax=unclassified Nocardioides TaxID=2615069 RepID=UPI003612EAEB